MSVYSNSVINIAGKITKINQAKKNNRNIKNNYNEGFNVLI